MARRNQPRAQRRPQGSPTVDSFQNLATRTGLGAPNINAASNYAFSPVSRNRVQLEYAYRSSWLAGAAVDTVAEDMTREGIELKGDIEPDQMEELERQASVLRLWDALCENVKWSRLYGGSLAVMLIDGQDVSTPLKTDTVTKGQFKGLLVLDRWMVQPTLENTIKELGPEMGKPVFYDVLADSAGLQSMRIHHSRCIRLDGVDLPYWQRIAENGWGQSVLERLWDRLIPFDSATEGAAQLVYKAHLRTYKVKGLREIIATGGKAFEGLVKQIDLVRQYQSNEGITLMDGEDEFEAHAYTFSGLTDVLLQFAQQLSGALSIPLIRLFGQAPAGLSGNHEGEIRNYYDGVKEQQEKKLRTGVRVVYDVLYRSTFGKPPPENFDIDFRPLWQMSDEQKANVAVQTTSAVTAAHDSGVIDRATALKELRQSGQKTGVFTNVTDEQIKEAEDEPPPPLPGELGDIPGQAPAGGGPGEEQADPEDPQGREAVRPGTAKAG